MDTKQIDNLIEKELNELRLKIWYEIDKYRRDEIIFKKCNKITQQILRTSGIHYEKTLDKDPIEEKGYKND